MSVATLKPPVYRGREVIPADGDVKFALVDQAPKSVPVASLLPFA